MPTRHFLTISLLAFVSCFFFAGCETGEPGVTTSQSRGSALTSGASIPYHYSQMVELRWVDASVGSRLVRTQGTSEVLAQEDFGGAGLHPLLQEQGQDTALASRTRFGGVVPTVLFGKDPGRNSTVEITWTFPSHDSERPALLQIPGSPPVTLSSNTVTVRYEIENITYKIFVNGEFIEERNYPVGAGVVQVPAFSSFVSGPHAITVVGTGTPDAVDGTWNYNQKKLVFAQETHDFDLDSDEPIEIVNSFGWDNGSPAVDPHWRLTLGGFNGFVKEGTGTEVQATWDPKNLILTQAEELEEISLNLTGFAEGYPGTEYIGGADGSVPSSKTGLQIVNETITPDPPFEEPGSSVMLTATAVLIDSELDTSDIMWTVDLEDSNGEPVVEEFESGNGPEIIAEWDGTVNGQPVDEPTTYQFHIYAEVCPNDGGGQASRAIRAQDGGSPMCDDGDDKRVALADTSILRVYNAAGDLLASSDDGENTLPMQKQVFPFGRKDNDNNLRITVEGLEESLPSVSVELEGVLSATPGTATLTYNSEEKVHEGTFEVTNSLIRIDQLQKDGLSVNTTFSDSVLPATGGAQVIFEAALANFQGLPYLPEQVQLGTFQENSDPATASVDQRNVLNFGFENLKFKLQDVGTAKAELKVRHPASVFYFLQHMGATGEIELGTTSLSPGDLTEDDATPLRSLILTACSGLALNDYNNLWDNSHPKFANLPDRQAIDFGGRKWYTKTRPGQTILLGFNHYAPAQLAPQIINEYMLQLDDLQGKLGQDDLTLSNLEALAWMKANRNILQGTDGSPLQRALCLNACAYSGDFYYYMPFDSVSKGPNRDNPLKENRQIHSVKKQDWENPLELADWLRTPKPKSEEVLIP